MTDFENLVKELSIKATFEFIKPDGSPDFYASDIANTYFEVHQTIARELHPYKDELF